ncbi:hypothetical protein ABKN59_002014 [Abortiporus biennis]
MRKYFVLRLDITLSNLARTKSCVFMSTVFDYDSHWHWQDKDKVTTTLRTRHCLFLAIFFLAFDEDATDVPGMNAVSCDLGRSLNNEHCLSAAQSKNVSIFITGSLVAVLRWSDKSHSSSLQRYPLRSSVDGKSSSMACFLACKAHHGFGPAVYSRRSQMWVVWSGIDRIMPTITDLRLGSETEGSRQHRRRRSPWYHRTSTRQMVHLRQLKFEGARPQLNQGLDHAILFPHIYSRRITLNAMLREEDPAWSWQYENKAKQFKAKFLTFRERMIRYVIPYTEWNIESLRRFCAPDQRTVHTRNLQWQRHLRLGPSYKEMS